MKEKKQRNFFRVLSHYKNYKNEVVPALIILVFAMVAGLTVPFINSFIVNNVIKIKDLTFFGIMVCSVLVLMSFETYIMFLKARVMSRNGFKVGAEIRQELFDKIQGLPLRFHDKMRKGDLLQRVTNYVDEISAFLANVAIIFAMNVYKLVIVLAFMLFIDVKLALIALAAISLNLIYMIFLKGVLAKKSKNTKVVEVVRTNEVVKNIDAQNMTIAFNRVDDSLLKYEKIIDDYTVIWMKYIRVFELFVPGVETIWYYGSMAIFLGSYFLLQDVTSALTIGAVIAFSGYITQMTQPLIQLGTVMQQLGGIDGAMKNIYEIIDEPITIPEKEGAKKFELVREKITFDQLTVKHGRKKVLSNVTFDVEKGIRLGITGDHKSGLDVIGDLLRRHEEPIEGGIKIDGVDLKDLQLHSIRNSIVEMDGEGFIFNTTVMENIKYGKIDATDEECVEAAKNANAHDFIMKLPHGYETVLSNRGMGLSAGERQLLAFSRILVHMPEVVVFDRVATYLGNKVKTKVISAIKKFFQEKTVVIISTDKDMLECTQKVVWLKAGKVYKTGTHQEFLEDEEYCKMLWEL